MIDLRSRHNTRELMDGDDISFTDMARTLKELNLINTRLGGHRITLMGVKKLCGSRKKISVCEIGCGGGDNLRVVYDWCRRSHIEVELTGIDLNPECIRYAALQQGGMGANWICNDYALVEFGARKPDIIFSSLFCHHFTDTQMIPLLQWQVANARLGFFINDLHRHQLAYYLIKYLTRWFSRSYLVRHDAAVSVSRGFRRSDLERLFTESNSGRCTISWKWAFRWLVIKQNH